MWISDISIRRPVFATMVIVSFMVLGVVSLARLGIDLFPEVNFPFVNISVVYPGASPEEVETLVTRPLEDAVAGINGVKRVVSSSTESFSRVGLELRLEIDPQAAAAEVREKVAAIRSRLPAAIEDPTIVRFDVAALPIMTFAVGSGQRSDRTRVQVEDDIKPLLEQIDGVAAVEVNGGAVREIQVDLDPRRLESPLLRIPAGVFGPTEQTFRVNMTRENIVRIDVSQPLYTGGRLTHAFGAQAAVQEGSRLEVERGQQALTLRVYETFYAALMADQGVRTTDEGVRIAERHLDLSRVRFEAGSAARLDVLRAEVELANARARLIRARTSADVSRQALRTVLSLPPDAPLQLSGTLDEVPALPAAVELQNAMAVRPDIRAFGQQREAAERQVALANAELKPIVALSGNFQYQEDGVGRLFGNSNRSSQVGVALQVPLFNAPAVAARRAVASARVRQAEHGVNAALDTARLELASASTEVEAAREIVATQEKAVALARESLGIAEVSYENGVITAAELNDARLSLLETEWELMQAKYAQIVAAAKTRFAAGL